MFEHNFLNVLLIICNLYISDWGEKSNINCVTSSDIDANIGCAPKYNFDNCLLD